MATLNEMKTRLSEDVQPTNTAARLSDTQIQRAIQYALNKLDSSLTLELLDEGQAETVLVGAASRCYWLIASKFAEGMHFQVEQDEFYAEQPYEHYIKLAREYGDDFLAVLGGATIEVSTLRRRSLATGQTVPLSPGDA